MKVTSYKRSFKKRKSLKNNKIKTKSNHELDIKKLASIHYGHLQQSWDVFAISNKHWTLTHDHQQQYSRQPQQRPISSLLGLIRKA